MSIKATIRVDHIIEKEKIDELMNKFLDKYDKYLVYEEVAEKTGKLHYQGVIYVPDMKAFNAMKTRLCGMFTGFPKGTKSMALVKNDNYEIYITKDKNVRFRKDFTDEDIKALEDQSYKKGAKEDKTLIDKVELAFDNWLKEQRIMDTKFKPRVDDIEEFLIACFFNMKKHWDTGVIAKYRNYLHYKLDPEDHVYFMKHYRRY